MGFPVWGACDVSTVRVHAKSHTQTSFMSSVAFYPVATMTSSRCFRQWGRRCGELRWFAHAGLSDAFFSLLTTFCGSECHSLFIYRMEKNISWDLNLLFSCFIFCPISCLLGKCGQQKLSISLLWSIHYFLVMFFLLIFFQRRTIHYFLVLLKWDFPHLSQKP